MEIRRFFVSKDDIEGQTVTLWGDEFAHMTKVLRYKVGYKAIICANDGIEHTCTVTEIARDCATLEIEKSEVVDSKSVEITLFAGLLKNNKLDFAIQKAVELGVDRIVPFTSANCAENKFYRDRANRIALEAGKQCGSVYISEVGDLLDFDDLLEELKDYDDIVFAYEFEKEHSIAQNLPKGKKIALVVGPEGGFQAEEAKSIIACGAKVVTLGKRILRAETASIILSALVLYGLGELSY